MKDNLNLVKRVLDLYESYKARKEFSELRQDLEEISSRVNEIDSELSVELEIDRMKRLMNTKVTEVETNEDLSSRIANMISVYSELKDMEDKLEGKVDEFSEKDWLKENYSSTLNPAKYEQNLRDLLSKIDERQELVYNKTRQLFLRDYQKERDLGKEAPKESFYIK